jgi:polyvinyl alcohol dehydrogenase (cytochrome)
VRSRTSGRRSVAAVLAIALTLALVIDDAGAACRSAVWLTGGHDRSGNRYQPDETTIGRDNVGQLVEKWAFTTGGDVSATPAVDEHNVYFPDFAGNLFALDRITGQPVWTVTVASLTGIPGDYARATPAVSGDLLVLGDQGGGRGNPSVPGSSGAYLFAVKKETGELAWTTKVDNHLAAIITQSAQIMGHTAYVGTSSSEEAIANVNSYPCCSFRGSFLSVDVRTGAVNWQRYLVPEGYSGGAVWGTTPSIDPSLHAVFISTGNNYSVPAATIDCLQPPPADQRGCFAPDDHFDSMLALDLDTGAVLWSRPGWDSDIYNWSCNPSRRPGGVPGPNCPPGDVDGPDYDFGQSPQLFDVKIGRRPRKVAGVGQKSGDYWLLDRATGKVIWKTHVGPGGYNGGLQWGSASDGERIYVARANSGNTAEPGYWVALDPATGAVLWKTDDPAWTTGRLSALAPVSVANGVVYACTENFAGTHLALDAATGAVLWSSASGGSCMAGAAIADGTVYWGSGYRRYGPVMSGNNVFRAYAPPGTASSGPG